VKVLERVWAWGFRMPLLGRASDPNGRRQRLDRFLRMVSIKTAVHPSLLVTVQGSSIATTGTKRHRRSAISEHRIDARMVGPRLQAANVVQDVGISPLTEAAYQYAWPNLWRRRVA